MVHSGRAAVTQFKTPKRTRMQENGTNKLLVSEKLTF